MAEERFNTSVEFGMQKCKERDAKRLKIDVSSVVCLSSSSIGDLMHLPSATPGKRLSTTQFSSSGQWMARAIAHSIPNPSKQYESKSPVSTASWEVVNDPALGLLVVPPSKLQFHHSVQLKDALGFTTAAQ